MNLTTNKKNNNVLKPHLTVVVCVIIGLHLVYKTKFMKKIFLIVVSVFSAIVVKSQNYTFSQSTYTAVGNLYPTKMLSGDSIGVELREG